MTLSQLRNNMTRDDMILHAAYFELLADEAPTPDAASAPARRPRRR